MTLNRRIIKLALPAIVSNITVPMLGLCDTAISGHLGSDVYLGAIAVGTMAVNTIFWCLGFLRMGTTGLTAQSFGANNSAGTRMLFTRSLMLGCALGLLMLLLSAPLGHFVLRIIGAAPEVSEAAFSYFRIVMLSAPAMLGTMAISGWFLGMQTSVQPMLIAVITNVINIAASIGCAFGFGLGFTGAALGTLIANWCGLALALLLAYRFSGGKLPLAPLGAALRKGGWSRFFNVNSFIFLRSFCIMAVTMGVTAQGARMGTSILAANVVIMQFFSFYSYFMDGFAFAGEALTGKAIGALDAAALRRTVRGLLLWGGGVMLTFFAIYSFAYSYIVALLTDSLNIRQLVDDYRMWIFIIPLSGGAFIFDGIFIGLTATRRMLYSALGGMIIFYAICWFPILSGNNNLWLAFMSYVMLRSLILALIYPSTSKAILLNCVQNPKL